MNCRNCKKTRDREWSFCPFCGISCGPFNDPVTDQEVDDIYGRMYKKREPFVRGSYGSGVRQQVLEVIVRQAIAGAPWREICAGPMEVNQITVEEVEEEIRRRRRGDDDKSQDCPVPRNPWKPQGSSNIALPLPMASEQLEAIRDQIAMIADPRKPVTVEFSKLIKELDFLLDRIRQLEIMVQETRDTQLAADLDREIQRNVVQFKQRIKPPHTDAPGPHHVEWNDNPEDDWG